MVPLSFVIPPTKGRIDDATLESNVRSACQRNWPEYPWMSHHRETWLICGGGPSIGEKEHLRTLRELSRRSKFRIIALNRTHDFLLKMGIKPWAGVLLDPSPPVKTYMTPVRGVKYFIASQCAPETLDVFEGAEKYLWHALATGAEQKPLSWKQKIHCVAGDSTVGLRAIPFGYALGARRFHLFGFDSSYKDNDPTTKQMHAYDKPETKHKVVPITIPFPEGEKTYWTNEMMGRQAGEFQETLLRFEREIKMGRIEPAGIWVHGSGLIPDMARHYGLHWDQKKEWLDVGRRLSSGRGCIRIPPTRDPASETGSVHC